MENEIDFYSILPSSALPKILKYRRAMSKSMPRIQQIEKTSTLNDKSPALTVNGRF